MSNLKALDYINARLTDERMAFFAPASNCKKSGDLTDKEFDLKYAYRGIKTFKRKALGLCGKGKIISSKDLTKLLCETNIADSVDEAMKIIPKLDGQIFYYPSYRWIRFDLENLDTYKIRTERF